MGFTAPWALAGLLLAALPVLLHLVQRRDPPERAFPAVRYLEDATRDHRRQARLRHLLLLACRTLLVLALVLAAAGATWRSAVPFGRHAPAALVLVVDRSASTAAVQGGAPAFDALRRAGTAVLERAGPDDRLWLLADDGLPRAGTAAELAGMLAELAPAPRGADLGALVGTARDLLATTGRRGEVVVVTDAQDAAITPTRGAGPLAVLRPAGPPPANAGLAPLDAGPQPWGGEGGQVTARLAADAGAPVAAVARAGERPLRELLLAPGAGAPVRIPPLPPGWHEVTVALAPDEFRLDDTARVAVRVAPPPTVAWTSGDRWLDAALGVLAADGRIRAGPGITLGTLAAGPSVVLPPEDPALLPALNRRLAARGVTWRFGAPIATAARLDSTAALPFRPALARRVSLVAGGTGAGDTLLTADGAPWAVRDGDVILLGSRLDPAWGELPISAGFVPLLDLLLTRAVRGEVPLPVVPAGEAVPLPGRADGVVHEGVRIAVEGGSPWRPATPGVHYLLTGVDTIGAVTAVLPAGESVLARAADATIRDRWAGAVVRDLDDAGEVVFAAAGRGDLRPLLLLVALLALLGEAILAGRGRSAALPR